jgi:hypothetical protein
MHREFDYLYCSLLRQAREREAERARLVARARGRPSDRRSWRPRAVVQAARQHVGLRLIEVGLRLVAQT